MCTAKQDRYYPYYLQTPARFEEFMRSDERGATTWTDELGNEFENPRHTLAYVAAYETGSAYGGPEEGGWWFDTGSPIAAIPVRTFTEAREAMDRLHDTFDEHFTGRWSSDPKLRVALSRKFPTKYPETRPHYE